MITPQSDIILLKSPLELTDINQITFNNREAQFNYFYNLPKVQMDDATYQRKDNVIRFPAPYDDIIQYNYVMYRNEGYSDKWFYAYITSMEYINDNMTAVSIKEDVFQTWQFDFRYKPCFVEREHTNNDTIGNNTVPENLEIGEYVNNGTTVDQIFAHPSGTNPYRIVAAVSDTGPLQFPDGFENIPVYNSVPSGLTYVVLKYNTTIEGIKTLYENQGKADAINSIFLVPYSSIDDSSISWQGNYGFLAALFADKSLGIFTANRPNNINGYRPRNGKLFTYPYCCLYLSNNCGSDVEMRWEDFSGGSASFESFCVINAGCGIKVVPKNYKGLASYYNEGIMGCKLPVCGWNSDTYTNWLTQNGVNIAWQDTQAAASLAALGFTSMPALAVGAIGALKMVGDNLNERQRMKAVPDQARGNLNGSDINFAHDKAGFTIYPVSIKAEFAQIVDDFFSMFGYKTNRVKIPNIKGRENWNYLKTVSSYVGGDIPQDSINEYKGLLDRGITFWHNPSTFMDYSQSNNIV